MSKIVVDTDDCVGCGYCYSIDPTHFAPNDMGYSTVIDDNPNGLVEDTIEGCPVGAIHIVSDEKTGDCHCEHCHCEEK